MKKSILKSKDKDKSNSSKKSKSKNNIKLPKIESTKKKQAKPNEKLVIPNQIPENSLSSILTLILHLLRFLIILFLLVSLAKDVNSSF